MAVTFDPAGKIDNFIYEMHGNLIAKTIRVNITELAFVIKSYGHFTIYP